MIRRLATFALLPWFTLAGYGQTGAASSAARTLAHLEDQAVMESSGVAASHRNPGILWTHNDSGDSAMVYAFDRAGKSHGRWEFTGAKSRDWEDIAVGPGPSAGRSYLYAADIGDNGMNRPEIVVYRVEEPLVGKKACRKGCQTEPAASLRLHYPDRPHNAEALLVHPGTGDLFIVTKANRQDLETRVYVVRAKQWAAQPVTLTLLTTLDIPEPMFRSMVGGITGGDISPDGRRIVLCDYFRMYEAELPAKEQFDEIWRQPFRSAGIGLSQTEGICYSADGKSILSTAEGSPCPLLEMPLTTLQP
jgi:hypothetical protein